MTKPELMTIIRLYKVINKTLEEVRDAVDAYSSDAMKNYYRVCICFVKGY